MKLYWRYKKNGKWTWRALGRDREFIRSFEEDLRPLTRKEKELISWILGEEE